MKRIKMAAALILWVCAAVRVLAGGFAGEKNVVSVFESMKYENAESVIEAFGDYGRANLSDDEKVRLAAGFAACLGINGGYEISEYENEGSKVTALHKNSQNGEVTLKVITVAGSGALFDACRQSIAVNIKLKGRTDCAVTYKNMVADLFEANGVDGYVNLNLCGEISGALNYYERNKAADELLEKLNAKVVAQNRDNDIFTVYAYTEDVEEYIVSAGRRVNINIVEEYDEIKDKTIIYLSTPLNNLDY